MIVQTKRVNYDAYRLPGPDADIELQMSFDNWLIRNQGDSLFRYADGSRLIISNSELSQTEAAPGDWVVAYDGGLCIYKREHFSELFDEVEE